MSSAATEVSPPIPLMNLLPGVVLVSGTAIGAGMLSMPIVSSGTWFYWSLLAMLICCFGMLQCSLLILKMGENYRPGASFDTYVKDGLGPWWNRLSNFLIAFIFYILLYAYISGGASILEASLKQHFSLGISTLWASIIFAIALSSIVWVSGLFTSRALTILMVSMGMAFALSMSGLLSDIKMEYLQPSSDNAYLYFIPVLPYFLTSFGFHCSVPSLVKIYEGERETVRKALYLGAALIFALYLLWLVAVFGNVEQLRFLNFLDQGGNVGTLPELIVGSEQGVKQLALSVFTSFALVTSFLGVGLGLFDFFADRFQFQDNPKGRTKTVLVTFLPPAVGATLLPNGFVYAIGYAGMALALSALCIPAIWILKNVREKKYRVSASLVLLIGISIFFIELGNILKVLPAVGS
ncbi:aromatic amino acid transport family protein [Pseudoteredinibacter isoporae]|uniref:Tryptophan-specific transport protein n=1 Tax=Pseudoteredinibacter isoporae TaxID=570281 RepID=A0A7X0MVG1_9GAMM|nr:aromatic amino acid transport family protein [Pseudoteredinibacter isoporae]MBB6521070.1 tryptophan-specific transport protein [Pseudoteredinibacter isoporae]NHO86634.1 tryptophan permease [Pseudoteredinibacter isoporae]NIB24914.1 tryptophan permease [Pseudoteredinibacter isoporae]